MTGLAPANMFSPSLIRVCCGFLIVILGLCGASVCPGAVLINEFSASNQNGLVDGYGNSPDWIELYNEGRYPVDLEGWFLTDDEDEPFKWVFPAGIQLAPLSYLVVFASGQETPGLDPAGHLHTNFALSKGGEYLALIMADGTVSHGFAPRYPAQQTDVSYGIWGTDQRFFGQTTPGAANQDPWVGLTAVPEPSRDRGFYEAPFDLVLTCATPDATIHFTLDGSEPSEQHGYSLHSGDAIPISTTVQIRAMACKTDWMPSAVITHTYLFVDHVVEQPADPPGWPGDWGYSSDAGAIVPADYEMDPRVANTTLEGYSVRQALLAIPSMSVSMLPDDFISDTTGIYANPQSRWERKCSVEYLLPEGGEGFQADCKIEIHGNASRRPFRMQKHSFRLTFTREYGPARLQYPLFPELDLNRFNQLVLRACFTDSWGLVSWSSSSRYRPNDSQYTRDVWMKESLTDMGQPSSHGNYVHLYVNGLYFGLFNLTERVGDDFFADHLGGEPEDWEINEDFGSPGPRWKAMMSIDPSSAAGYARMQEFVDVNNFADYMLLHFYADAEDWPHHNGYAAANAVSGDGRFRFFVWDQEIVLDYHGRAATRINQAGGVGDLFQKMRTSPEFRQLFADRVYRHCFNEGALSVTASQYRYAKIAFAIDKAIVAESARWGDTQMSTPYGNAIEQPHPLSDINHNVYPAAPHGPDYYFTREDSWVVERDNLIHNYIPAIHDLSNSYAIINVLRAADLYPVADPPSFRINDMPQHGGTIHLGDLLSMLNPQDRGTIYYTLDGTDPRVPASGESDSVQTLIPEDAAKRIWVPTFDSGLAWTGGAEPFDDTAWGDGLPLREGRPGGIGYERSSGYDSFIRHDVESAMFNQTESCYIRIPFTVNPADQARFNLMTLRLHYDDGFIAYLNGVPIAAANAPESPAWNSGATASHSDIEAIALQDFDCSAFLEALQPGDNVLAIHGLNYRAASSDFLISAELVAGVRTSSGPASSSAAGYEAPIRLTETTEVKARVWTDGTWSALAEAVFEVSP